MDPALLRRVNEARRSRHAAILATDMETGNGRLFLEGDELSGEPLGDELVDRFRSGLSGMARTAGASPTLLTVRLPDPRFVIIGAVHISQALAPMAGLAGFDVTIIDPRTAFASNTRFPDVQLVTAWPEEALADIPLDPHTALAALTHDPKIDDVPLKAALETGCFYVGALGSRKTHAKRRDRLAASGLAATLIDRIHAPIGLDIRARTPSEIAVAVLADVIGTMRVRELVSAT